MALDASKIVSGPATFELASESIGHTQGGIQATITPNNRARVVDQYGTATVNVVHLGDTVRMTVPFAEWAAATIAEVYNPGLDMTAFASSPKYMGVGRKPGYLYTDQQAAIIPLTSADTGKFVMFWAVTPIGELQLMFNTEADRIFSTEFACMVDESKTDGELIGKIHLTGTAP
jgi:hypothetical protein